MNTTSSTRPPLAPLQMSDLLGKSQAELDAIFMGHPAGPIPSGNSEGQAIVCPGSFWSRIIARFVHSLAWQGKVFTLDPDRQSGTLENKITVAGVQAIVARVYHTQSWLDGRDCIVLDYSKTSLLARKIRDEIRLIDPVNKIYLGKVWWGKTRLIDFALKFPT